MNKSVAQIQEEIKECRGNRTGGYWIMGIGMLFAIFPFFLQLVVLVLAILANRPNPGIAGLEYLAWSLPIGIAVAIAGIAVAVYYDHKMKRLIKNLDEK